jgi:hypothetical protein
VRRPKNLKNFCFPASTPQLDAASSRIILGVAAYPAMTSLRQYIRLYMPSFGRTRDHIIPAAVVDILEGANRLTPDALATPQVRWLVCR